LSNVFNFNIFTNEGNFHYKSNNENKRVINKHQTKNNLKIVHTQSGTALLFGIIVTIRCHLLEQLEAAAEKAPVQQEKLVSVRHLLP